MSNDRRAAEHDDLPSNKKPEESPNPVTVVRGSNHDTETPGREQTKDLDHSGEFDVLNTFFEYRDRVERGEAPSLLIEVLDDDQNQ